MERRLTKKLGEKSDLEFKSKFDGTDREWLKLIKTIVAMANKSGGRIIYTTVNDKIFELDSSNVDNKVNSYITPKLRGLITRRTRNGIEVIVPNSDLKPHIFIRRGSYKNEKGTEVVEFYEGQIWVRHSSKNELLDKSDFDAIVQENIRRFIERINIIAAQYPTSILESSETGFTMKIKPVKDKKNGIPVVIEKETIDPNILYPYQAKDLARLLDKNRAYVIQLLKILKIKGDPRYSFHYKDSSGRVILIKYNDKCLELIREFLIKNPNFNPWRDKL